MPKLAVVPPLLLKASTGLYAQLALIGALPSQLKPVGEMFSCPV
jgi:hypothetical protein